MLAKVHQKYEAQGFAVLPLSVDEPEQESKIAPMLKEYGFDGPYYVATRPLDALKRSLSENWPGNIPVSFLLGSSAQRLYFWTAEVYENELTPKVDLFLQGKLVPGQTDFAVAPGKTL
jgi:hypothetical protein